MERRFVGVPGARLEVHDWGRGQPLVLIQTALLADELRPLATDPALADSYRKILYHRRGYAASSGVEGPGSVVRDAGDCAALLADLGIERAHVVGLSYSGAVALQLAADAPRLVRTLSLLEPPPVHTPSAAEFRAANDRLLRSRRLHGPQAALDEFLGLVIGPNWRRVVEERLPGASAQMERDVVTFFDTDLPALLRWQFPRTDLDRVTCPVLHVGGTDSGPWFAEVRDLVLEWFPHADDALIDGADHSLALTHATEVAAVLEAFLRRH